MIQFQNIRSAENINDYILPLKTKLEQLINLEAYSHLVKNVSTSNNMIHRFALFAGLTIGKIRELQAIEAIKLHGGGNNFHDTAFSKGNLQALWSALLKLKYKNLNIDWEDRSLKSKILNYEIIEGSKYLLEKDNLKEWLLEEIQSSDSKNYGSIPVLDLLIGSYEDDIPAKLNLNARDISNTQILIAGSTGSGKSNLLAVLINQIRTATVETSYPVNFLLFDYKGEFSDPANKSWLNLFETNTGAILDPITSPLPFTPFKNFEMRPQNEINLYATELANALSAIDKASISANMSDRLATAVINSYKKTKNKPINFEILKEQYTVLQDEKDQKKTDSVKSVLNQLIRSKLFEDYDKIDLINESFIIKMDGFPKDGPIAKAIVYFIISKLNIIYEKLPKQNVSEDCVEIRHFTIIDEAHYMLNFDNKPLRDLIAIGRNKGISIILATQNMEHFKSKYFDFYANAQYPLIMKQQTIADSVIKDLFGVSGNEFQEIKEAIGNLKLGELIIKDVVAAQLGIGKKYKKIKTTHLI